MVPLTFFFIFPDFRERRGGGIPHSSPLGYALGFFRIAATPTKNFSPSTSRRSVFTWAKWNVALCLRSFPTPPIGLPANAHCWWRAPQLQPIPLHSPPHQHHPAAIPPPPPHPPRFSRLLCCFATIRSTIFWHPSTPGTHWLGRMSGNGRTCSAGIAQTLRSTTSWWMMSWCQNEWW